MRYNFEKRYELGWMVRADGNKKLPRYRWFPYKESFSKQLVDILLDSVKKYKVVLDPFAGVSTTLLACKERGDLCVGIEASKLGLCVSKAKLSDYDVEELKKEFKTIVMKRGREEKGEVEVNNKFIKKVFRKSDLEDLIVLKKIIERYVKNKHFFLLALANASAKASRIAKDSAYFKPKKPMGSVVDLFEKEVKRQIGDVAKFPKNGKSNYQVLMRGDARSMSVGDERVDVIITSPPYLKKEEYLKIYAIERFVFFGDTVEEGPFFGYAENDDFEKKMEAYFRDVELFMAESFRVLRNGGKAFVVVSDACFKGKRICVAEKLGRIAEEVGFEVKKIYVVNKRFCTVKRTIKKDIVYEYIIRLRKEKV